MDLVRCTACVEIVHGQLKSGRTVLVDDECELCGGHVHVQSQHAIHDSINYLVTPDPEELPAEVLGAFRLHGLKVAIELRDKMAAEQAQRQQRA